MASGMIIDGVAASEAVDSSGEVLDLEGLDISDLENGVGVLNWEHRGEDAAGASANDIIGKIVYAKKVFKASDCENDRQRSYWDKVKLPFLYIVCRLFDGAGHPGAIAAAAMIRDYQENGEPILVRYSIEGSTLEKKGNRLVSCVARRVAATIKPCNRSCHSGVLEDPNHPTGAKTEADARDVLEELVTEKNEHQHPNFTKLGGSYEIECDPRLEETPDLVKTLVKLKTFAAMKKAIAAGTTSGAPGTLTGGAALQREDSSLHVARWKKAAMEAFKEYDKSPKPFEKAEFKSFLKHKLPDCDPDFIDRFTDLIDDVKAKLAKAAPAPAGTEDVDTSFDFGENQDKYADAQQMISRMRPVKRALAQNFLRYVQGHTQNRPHITPDLERHLARFGVVDPKGYEYDQNGRSMARPTPGGKANGPVGEQPAELKRIKLMNMGYDLPYQRSEAEEKDLAKADPKKTKAPKAAKTPKKVADQVVDPPPVLDEAPQAPAPDAVLTIRGKPAPIPAGVTEPHFDMKTGTLHTPRGSFKMYIPGRDKSRGPDGVRADEAYRGILSDPKVNKFHDYAMEQWGKVNKLLKEGRLPPEVVMHATLFSQLSPNTPVPMQEMMYAHLVDSMRHTGIDARSPLFSGIRDDWKGRDNPNKFPDHSADYWEENQDKLRLKNTSYVQEYVSGSQANGGKAKHKKVLGADGKPIVNRLEGQIGGFQLADNKWLNMERYHTLHQGLVDLVNKHRDNARSGVSELMHHKVAAALWANKRKNRLKSKNEKNRIDIGPYTLGPDVPGLAPKTGRYTWGMLGGGNVQVPDTHHVRHIFGLSKKKKGKNTPAGDNDTIEYIKTILWNERNSHILDGMDKYYAKHHDSVKHMLEHPRWGSLFEGNPENAIFPAFWKNWVSIVPHEDARGINAGGFNEYTDHRPFWEAIQPYVDRALHKHEIDAADPHLPYKTARLHQHWVQQYGHVPAMMLYFGHIVPQLLRRHEEAEKDPVLKAEALLVDLRKAMAEDMVPGRAVSGKKQFEIVREHADHYLVRDGGGLARLPKRGQGLHYDVKSKPQKAKSPGIVDAVKHAIHGQGPEQHALVHGANLDAHHPHERGFKALGNGKVAHLHGDPMEMGWNSAKSEAAYYNAARDVFGMHQYLPVAAAFRHPHEPVDMAAVEAVPMAEHMDTDDQAKVRGPHAQVIKHLGDQGELDKMMLMDMVMGNHDRSDHNVVFTFHSEPHMRLVDHGDLDGLNGYGPRQDRPSYMTHYGHSVGSPWQSLPLHEKARTWLQGLDHAKLENTLRASGMPAKQIEEASRRLFEAKLHSHRLGSTATKGSVYMAPWSHF